MGNRPKKYQEPFVPEGLEFREEYMHSALNLYKATKRSLFIKKVFVYSGIAAVLSGVVLVVCLNGSKDVDQFVQPQNGAVTNINSEKTSSANDGLNKQANEAAHSGAMLQNNEPIAQENVSSNHEEISTTSSGDSKILKSKSTFDHGGSTSSGVGSPDRKSIVKEKNYPSRSSEKYHSSSDVVNNFSGNNEIKSASDGKNSEENLISNASVHENENKEELAVVTNLNTSESAILADAASIINLAPVESLPYKEAKLIVEDIALLVPKGIGPTSIRKFIPYIEAGIVPLASFGSQNFDLRADPFLAAGVDYRTKTHLMLGARLNYYSVSGMSHPFEVSQTEYGQGFTTITTTYYTERLHYISFSPMVSKIFCGNHQLIFGGDVEYLLTGNNRIENGSYSSLEKRPISSREASGYIGAFRDVNYAVNVGYQYWFGKNKAIGLNYKFGLTDITKNDYFRNDMFDRNSMLSLYFRMNLM